jgi:phage-related protein
MSNLTYSTAMAEEDKPVVWLAGEVKTPPFSKDARLEAGFLLRRLQKGGDVKMPQARTMPSVGRRCRELRIRDENKNWRIMVRIDEDAVVVVDVFEKKTRTTPAKVIAVCKDRLKRYDEIVKG